MADIELVVKIDAEDYKEALDVNNRDCNWNNMHSCYEAILKRHTTSKRTWKIDR